MKLIHTRKISDTQNLMWTELEKWQSFKTTKIRLGIGRNQLLAFINANDSAKIMM